MRAAISTELLLRLMNATEEQYAAIAKILGVEVQGSSVKGSAEECGMRNAEGEGGMRTAEEESDGVNAETLKTDKLKGEAEPEPQTTEEVARSAFALLHKLDVDAPLKAPSVLTVFRLYCKDGHSADEVARRCRCAKGTVMARLRFIEQRTGVKAEQFRAMSGHLQRMDDELRTSGAREIYRKGLC